VIVKTFESTPNDATHWSTRSMAQASGLSQPTVSRIWRTFGLQPNRSETFKLSTDPLFVDKVRDRVSGPVADPGRRLPRRLRDQDAEHVALALRVAHRSSVYRNLRPRAGGASVADLRIQWADRPIDR
jgi:hypothetical protein